MIKNIEGTEDSIMKGMKIITEITPLEMVHEFHSYSGHPIEGKLIFPKFKEHKFRVDFIKEEVMEADNAYNNWDIVNYADALGDLQYVLDGWFLVSGLWNKKQEIMEEIHRSNMTKFCKTVEEAERTIDKLITNEVNTLDALEGQYEMENFFYTEIGEYFVVKNSRGKVMKGINYEPPKLEEIIYGKQ